MITNFKCKYCGRVGSKESLKRHYCHMAPAYEHHDHNDDINFLNTLLIMNMSGHWVSYDDEETSKTIADFTGGGGEFGGAGATGSYESSSSYDSGSSDSSYDSGSSDLGSSSDY